MLYFTFLSLFGHCIALLNFSVPQSYLTTTFPKLAFADSKSAAVNFSSLKKFSKSQFKEDKVLYENYFYGLKNGTILESGAFVS